MNECGIKSPSVDIIQKIARTLKVPVSVMLGEEDTQELVEYEARNRELDYRILTL